MEAVPRLHMLWFALKSSPEGTSFAALKKYIAEFYHEDPEAYSKEVHALEILRNQAMRTTNDGAAIMKRYYCQLHALQNRFPQLAERGIFSFTWKDLYHNTVHEVSDMRFERAAVLFNIAASHTQEGASVTRGDVDGMKMACTHFQAAAWAYNELNEHYANVNDGGDFMTPELLMFQQQVCLAQAQECILEKSLIDNRKPHVVAKVTAQIVVYYGAALASLLTGGDDGPVGQVIDRAVYNLWKKYVRFKINYLNCILFLYQGQHAEEQRKMGERVTLYQASWDKLEEARKGSKGLPDQTEINESLSFTADVVEAKRKNAKNENEFIYHETVPELGTIPAVQGANLVNGIGFSVLDEEFADADIFARLVPMKAHEASSMYSEEKAKLLRKYSALLEAKDQQLDGYMSSLTLDNLNINEEQANKLPQGIVDRCAALNANKTAISDLVEAMSQLAEITAEVETNLNDLKLMLEAEAKEEIEFQNLSGVQRTPNAHITELTREFQKYNEAHTRAGESNNTLRKAMSLHVNNLKILARPLQEIQQLMPKLSTELNTAEIFKDVKLVLNKVNEMKAQRAQFHADLRIAINEDDITAKVIAHGGQEGLQALFSSELAKHERITQLLDQNMLAQQNILQALTENYAKAAPVLKTLQDVKQKREHFYSSLAASYDVYEDLLAKSAKGLEFYKKLAGNVQKLLSRFKSARDVQSEERQQRMESVKGPAPAASTKTDIPVPLCTNASTVPKLRDYLKGKAGGANLDPNPSSYLNTVRPVPVGSENPTQAACSAYATAPPPNEPPPPYSLQQQQYYDPSAAGYTNPMYQQQQQHVAPPAYKAQPSPNSQTLHGAIEQLSIQSQDTAQLPLGGPSYNYNYSNPISVETTSAAPLAYNYQQPLYVATTNNQQPADVTSSLQAPYGVNSYQLSGYQPQGYPQSSQIYTQVGAANVSMFSQAACYPHSQQSSVGFSQSQAAATAYASQQPALYSSQSGQVSQPNPGDAVPPNATQSFQYPQPSNDVQHAAAVPVAPAAIPPPSIVSPHSISSLPASNSVPSIAPTSYHTTTPTLSVTAPISNATAGILASNPVATNGPKFISYSNHPGYGFNPQTGIYDYSSGYQQEVSYALHGHYGYQFTQSGEQNVGTTDSENANRSNVATGFDSPIVSHTKAAVTMNETSPPDTDKSKGQTYYTAPYGYHSTASADPSEIIQQPIAPAPSTPTPSSSSIYMQSGGCSIANTNTTTSSAYASLTASKQPKNTQETAARRSPSNVDLLSDLDLDTSVSVPPPLMPQPVLHPQVVLTATQPASQELTKTQLELPALVSPDVATATGAPARRPSMDNLSNCSDLSSLENFDWDSVSLSAQSQASNDHHHHPLPTFQVVFQDPFKDNKILKYFHKEVESFEKMVENLHIKMLNGNTQLKAKWQELQQKLDMPANAKRSTTLAKLFPEKNRSLDCLPYDHARVKLDKQTDDYINAAYIKNLSAGCPNFIIAQTPQSNTINDFWSMVWSEKARTVICLHTTNELLDPYWPQALNRPTHYDDFTVTCVKIQQLSNSSEYQLKLSMHGADPILDLSLLQLKQWTKGSNTHVLDIAQNALETHQQRCSASESHNSPLVMNCLTGSERSEIVAIGICALMATQSKRPILLNVVDVWSRICSQRQNSLRDSAVIEQSMQLVLCHAHNVLNKRGIMTSYQMKMAPLVTAKEQPQTKDPLNDLDALWKLK
ncbi:uncharacterized protein Dwil_GK10583 [Drosophila willistoni]|uniref:Tyrosine-protein phosphatase non-receptor type 23 n=1 Tax=Drosophila willistoni TaxID=7260 RepID=B4NM21_DROWI|nr:tyrosine-protein phosphatase non-receptor type 23 isoform X1 [Drosophila willistoni]EDW85389.2 uncharacterized protein Dwil_GK10583 [Drosophila willistoni]